MADALLDTCVFIDYVRGEPKGKALLMPFLSLEKKGSYSTLTVAEIWRGETMTDRKEEIQYQAILTLMEEASLTTSIARVAGSRLRGLSRNLQGVLFADALIAATAEERGEPIYSRNVKDLTRFYSNVLTY